MNGKIVIIVSKGVD